MGWMSMVIGALTLAREIFKYLNSQAEDRAHARSKMKDMKLAIRRAREEGKTDDIEKLLSSISDTDSQL